MKNTLHRGFKAESKKEKCTTFHFSVPADFISFLEEKKNK